MRNKQLKIFILITTIVFTLIYLQTRFNIFPNISSQNHTKTEINENKANINPSRKSELPLPQEDPTVILFKNKNTEITANLAQTSQEKSRGLMFIEKLDKNRGLLFVYKDDTTGKFWMKNCKINLDIIFINKYGEIIHISQNVPPCRKDPCTLYGPVLPYRYVLEVNGGFCNKKDINEGNKISWK